VLSPESLSVKTSLCVELIAKLFVSLPMITPRLFASLIRANETGPESSGWSQPLQAPNDCAWTPYEPVHGL
jgi:hypothetical protein